MLQTVGTYDVGPCITLPSDVQWASLQAWKHFDEIAQEAHLVSIVNQGTFDIPCHPQSQYPSGLRCRLRWRVSMGERSDPSKYYSPNPVISEVA